MKVHLEIQRRKSMGWIESAVLMAVKCGLDQKVENEVKIMKHIMLV